MKRKNVTNIKRCGHQGEGGRWRRWFAAFTMLLSIPAAPSSAQTYPERSLKLVVPFAPGGIVDLVGRALGPRLEIELKQPVVIENRTSGGSTVGTASVANSPADGYTLLVVDPSVSITPSLRQNPPYQLGQLKTLATLTTAPLMVVVNPQLPIHSIRDLVEYSKSSPGGISYASAGIGTTTHLAPELLKVQTGFNATHVPYRGGGPSLPDLLSGRVQTAFYSNATVLPMINEGKLRAVAQTGTRRIKATPNVPTAMESGYPDFVVELWTALFAPAGLPADVERRLSEAVRKAVETPEFIAAVQGAGLEGFYKAGPSAVAFVQAEHDRWTGLIRAARIVDN
ncbi:MAG: tripartite tricarboxylate transporter substrate binding protein [Hyphomicrobiales bacterium]|nr:tripartite tricarboxylate transporter substrate binding protein [Hyphomicrobiales bacterium]